MAQDINVVILGGCGFLGQHIVSELLTEKERMKTKPTEGGADEKSINIKKIKVLDLRPFTEDCLTSKREDGKAVEYQECDIRNVEKLTEKLKGATAVINCAAVVPDFSKEDLGCGDHMDQVNIFGVQNLVKACQESGISALIHTSTVNVKVGGWQKLVEHTETLSPEVPEDQLIFGDYARGRLKAEKLVLDAHGTKSKDGTTLRTVVLRPPLVYGEGDRFFVPFIQKLAKADGNRCPSVGNPDAFQQAAYAGNIAVAHVCALKHMITDEEDSSLLTCGGLPVYITDDTPPNNMPGLAVQFLSHLGFGPSQLLSYWTTSLYLYWEQLKAMMGMKAERNELSPLPTWTLHRFAGHIIVVSRMRAELCLGYSPPYSWEESLKRSNLYYSSKLT